MNNSIFIGLIIAFLPSIMVISVFLLIWVSELKRANIKLLTLITQFDRDNKHIDTRLSNIEHSNKEQIELVHERITKTQTELKQLDKELRIEIDKKIEKTNYAVKDIENRIELCQTFHRK